MYYKHAGPFLTSRFRFRDALDQRHRCAADCLAPADVADTFAGLRLDVDRVACQPQQLRQSPADRVLDGAEFGLLGEDRYIHVDNPPAAAVQALERLIKEQTR